MSKDFELYNFDNVNRFGGFDLTILAITIDLPTKIIFENDLSTMKTTSNII